MDRREMTGQMLACNAGIVRRSFFLLISMAYILGSFDSKGILQDFSEDQGIFPMKVVCTGL
jgi:hypothetical protein